MLVITASRFFEELRRVAKVREANAAALVDMPRAAFFRFQAGKAISAQNAQRILAAAANLIDPEIVELIDGAGNHHFAPALTQRTTRLIGEVEHLRRLVITRAKCAVTADEVPVAIRRHRA